MNKLIEFFNEKYGDKYGKIPYPRTTMQIYRVYQSIKSYGIKDEELVKLLHNIKLPKPKTIEEKELYADCLYNKDDSEIKIDTSNLVSKESPVFTGSMSMGRKEGTSIGENSYAIGYNVEASGDSSHAEGAYTNASGETSHAEGISTQATGEGSHAEGQDTQASGFHSHAEGENSIASGAISHAEGWYTQAKGNCSHAEGENSIASSDHQHVQGRYNIEDAANKYAHIVGNGDYDTRSNAHTLDWNGNAWFAGRVEGTNLPYVVSSKVLATVPASDIKLNDEITVNNISINKDRKYYIEFLGSKNLCNVVISEIGNQLTCAIGNYAIQGIIFSSNLMLGVHKISADDTAIDTFTDLVIYEEEIKCLDNKYLENDLRVQNSISLGRVGNIGTESSAIGMDVRATGMASHAEGYGAIASGNFSHAEGSFTKALCEDSHAEGSNTIASSDYQHVQGKYNIEDTNNKYAHIVGNGEDGNTRANAHTLDWKGNAWYAGDVQANNVPYVVGEKVVLTIPAATISAKKTEIDNNTDDSEPVQIPVDGVVTFDPTKSYYLKYNNKEYQVLVEERMGVCFEDECYCGFMPQESTPTIIIIILTLDTTNITDMQLIEKDVKKLDNIYVPNDLRVSNSITVGARRGVNGLFSSSFGTSCEASGEFSQALGSATIASGGCSHAEGEGTTASGDSSHAEGSSNNASGNSSHAEGSNTTASGDYSHAEGYKTVASGSISHAEGNTATASGNYSHAEGNATTASGYNSHAEGHGTIAHGENQHAEGKYNIEDTDDKYAHIVGNGNSNNKSNAHTLDWQGNGWYAGKLSQEGTPTEDKDLVTKKYADASLENKVDKSQLSFNSDGELVVTIDGISKTFVPKA